MYISYEQLSSDLKKQSADFWIKKGEGFALDLFHKAAQEVPAYKDFLHKENIHHEKIKTIHDFTAQVPIIDKENYVSKYDISDLCLQGDITQGTLIAQSSGTTSEPYFWPRFTRYDDETAIIHEVFFRDLYGVENKKTLFIVCFYLGAHIAGIITSNAIRDMLHKGLPGSLVTAGINKKDIFNSLKKLSPLFEQTVLIGYPPFLRDLMLEADQHDIELDNIQIKFMFSAEAFPENWRDNLYEKTRISDRSNGGFSVYGCSEIGFMGHETEYSIFIRKTLEHNKSLRECLGLSNGYVPALYQYHAWNKYFESIDNHLVCTSDNGVPLVRYDTKDIGTIHTANELLRYVSEDFNKHNIWELPFITVFGRSDYTATVYGVNIYPEHIKVILSSEDFISISRDTFFLKTIYEDGQQYIEIHIELLQNIHIIDHDTTVLSNIFFKKLCMVNMEYHKLYDVIGDKVRPHIFFYEYGSSSFYNLKSKNRYIVK